MRVQVLVLGLAISACSGLAQGQLSLRQVQQILKDKGYYNAAVDGINGPGTRQAISDYQKSQGIPVTGRLDAQTTAKLRPAGSSDTIGSAEKEVKSAGTTAKSGAGDSVGSATKEAKSATTKSTAGLGDTVTGAGKDGVFFDIRVMNSPRPVRPQCFRPDSFCAHPAVPARLRRVYGELPFRDRHASFSKYRGARCAS